MSLNEYSVENLALKELGIRKLLKRARSEAMRTLKVFITDARSRMCLTVARSLGKAGYYVAVGDHETRRSLSFYSKFIRQSLLYPNPLISEGAFLKAVKRIARHFDVIIPILEKSMVPLAKNKEFLEGEGTRLLMPDAGPLEVAMDKYRLYIVANSAGVPCPKTLLIEDLRDLRRAVKEIGLPLVLKVRREMSIPPEKRFAIIKAPDNLYLQAKRLLRIGGDSILAQEFIKGEKVGCFYLFNRHGDLVAYFCHHRLVETPGGISAFCESYFHAEALSNGLKLLKKLKWKGVAMAEFVIKEDGKPMLLEVNPRFWGSLPLAIAAGVDFPRLLVETWDVKVNRPLGHYEHIRCLILMALLDMLAISRSLKDVLSAFKVILENLSANTRIFELMESDVAPFMIRAFGKTILGWL